MTTQRSTRQLPALQYATLAVLLGVVAGFGAYAFRVLIAVVHNLMFLGTLSASYDTNVHTAAAPWGIAVALAPPIAALAVVFVVDRWAPEARGHGVPEIMDAVYFRRGVIRPIVAVVKSIASSLSIGSGGSVGREGPIAQIGAAFGSWSGGLARAQRWQVTTLVAAGAGAGIAATFNTPIGGVLFAVELLLPEISVRTMVPVTLATATATYIARWLFGNHPAFPIPSLHMPAVTELALMPVYAGLGALTAVAAAAFIRGLYATESRSEALVRNPYVRHGLGMLVVGVMMVALHATLGHYYIQGVGYATVLDILTHTLTDPWVLILLFALKLASTSLTLGSGASGGIFSPSLFMGATLGGALGIVLNAAFPSLHCNPAAFAVAGMAGMIAATTGAPLTAIVMLFEMTRDYTTILPMALAVAVAHGLRLRLVADTIYTLKLSRRGHMLPRAMQAATYLAHQLGSLPRVPLAAVAAADPAARVTAGTAPFVAIVDGDEVVGLIERARLDPARVSAAAHAGELINVDHLALPADDSVASALVAARRADAAVVIVTRGHELLGVVHRAQLADLVADELVALAD